MQWEILRDILAKLDLDGSWMKIGIPDTEWM